MSDQEERQCGPIPSRWLKCPPKSLEFLNNKFLIFKTPLSSCYDDQVKDDIFQVQLVFQSMKNKRVKLGLWVDLTNTTRYYDRKEVENHDCRYVKLQCEGHGGAPSKSQTQLFIKMCHNFIRQYPLEVIGVHCTHGFNRSGFLVVSYLVEVLDWELGAAIAEFARIRPPGIYKQDYLTELYTRYDDVSFAPQAPPLPDWCYEEESNRKRKFNMCEYDADYDYSEKKRKICITNPKFMEGVSGVEPVSGELLIDIQKTVSKMCGWNRSGFPGCQPVSLSIDNLHLLSEKPYSVSWKADGVRYMLYIRTRNQVYCIDRDYNVFLVKNLTFPHRKDLNRHITDTLLDGEMVLDKLDDGSIRPRYLVYDAIIMQKYDIKKDTFTIRHKSIEMEICNPREEASMRRLINKFKEPFSIRQKEFLDIIYAQKFLEDRFKKYLSHPPDGLIFQPTEDPYIPGRCDTVLKWKPLSLNSVDFKLKIVTESGEGILPRKVGKLYTGGNTYFGELLSLKNAKHLNDKIIECTLDEKTKKWVFLRERTDKSFPNSFDTATNVYRSIRDPITESYLIEFIARKRFGKYQENSGHGSNDFLQLDD